MSNVTRKIRRRLVRMGKAKPLPAKLYQFNLRVADRIRRNPLATRMHQLHATKGDRKSVV